MKKIVEMTHDIIRNYTKSKGIAVDFTMGNGYDTLFLAQQDFAKVIAFDIQEESLMRTKALLQQEKQLAKVNLICDGHENLDAYVSAFDVGIFNFGYLPQTDKCVTTKLATSKIAVEKALACLAVYGVLLLVLYPGHEDGKKEADYFLEKAKALPSKQFAICHIALMNKKQAPSILVIERQAKG